MATRASMQALFQQCEDAIRFAEEQYKTASLQEHYNNDDYTKAQQDLEQMYQDIAKVAHSANGQQREQLHRMRLQIQQLQNYRGLYRVAVRIDVDDARHTGEVLCLSEGVAQPRVISETTSRDRVKKYTRRVVS